MSGKKEFDCVEMKNAIQARLRKRYRGLSDEEVRRRIAHRLETSDDPIARKWREIEATVVEDVRPAPPD